MTAGAFFNIFAWAHIYTTAVPSRSGSLQRCYEAHICIIVTTLMYKLIQQTISVDFGAGWVGLGCWYSVGLVRRGVSVGRAPLWCIGARESEIIIVLFATVILSSLAISLSALQPISFPLGHKKCKMYHMSLSEHCFEIVVFLTIVFLSGILFGVLWCLYWVNGNSGRDFGESASRRKGRAHF